MKGLSVEGRGQERNKAMYRLIDQLTDRMTEWRERLRDGETTKSPQTTMQMLH